MTKHSDYDSPPRETSDDCAESRGGTEAHTLPVEEGEPRAVAAPTVAAQPFRKKHPRDVTFDCGCTEKREVDFEKHWIPPDPSCPACSGYGVGGKIRDRHHYLQIKRSVGATAADSGGMGREGHHAHTSVDELGQDVEPLEVYFPDGRWSIDRAVSSTGNRAGRPKTTTPNLEVTKIYMVDVANEVVKEFEKILELEGADFMLAFDVVTNIMLARGKSANVRLLAEWLPFSKNTIYRRRKKGRRMEKLFEVMFSDRFDRIEASLQRIENAQEGHAVEMFRRLYGLSEEDMEVTEEEFGLD